MTDRKWSIAETYNKVHMPDRFNVVDVVTHHAMLADSVPKRLIEKYGLMTKDEAIAMMKLLNASRTY